MRRSPSFDEKALFVADQIYRSCIAPDGGELLRLTGALAPGGSLKMSKAREAFRWCQSEEIEGRFFTLRLCHKAVSLLVAQQRIEIPALPGLSQSFWLAEQAKRLHYLCCRSKKNRLACSLPSSKEAKAEAMDDAETQPMFYDDDGLLPYNFCAVPRLPRPVVEKREIPPVPPFNVHAVEVGQTC